MPKFYSYQFLSEQYQNYQKIFSLPKSSIVIDTSNYYPEQRKEEFDESKPESVWISEQIGRNVIKTFNNILAYSLEHSGKDKNEKNRLCIQIVEMMKNRKKLL